jgi:hypothetical protein
LACHSYNVKNKWNRRMNIRIIRIKFQLWTATVSPVVKKAWTSITVCSQSVQSSLSQRLQRQRVKFHYWNLRKYQSTSCFIRVCEKCSFIKREEYRLEVSEDRMLRKIFYCKWQEVRGEYKKCSITRSFTWAIQ